MLGDWCRPSSETSVGTGVFSVRLTWARLGFRVNITRSGVAGALGEEVVSQRLSTEIWGPGRCAWLLNPSPAPQILRDSLCPLAASLIGARHRDRNKEGKVGEWREGSREKSEMGE